MNNKKLYIVTRINHRPYNIGNQFIPVKEFCSWKEADKYRRSLPKSKNHHHWIIIFP